MPESEKNALGGYSGGGHTRRIKFGELTIEGFSRAPIKSFWRIPELKLGFDLGWQPWEHMGTPRWFITHTHMDHILALPAYAARRQMMDMTPTLLNSLAMGAVVYFLTMMVEGNVLKLVVGTAAGMALYLAVAWLFRLPEDCSRRLRHKSQNRNPGRGKRLQA